MRLFTTREAKEESQKQTKERIESLSFLTGEEARLRASINAANDEFNKRLKEQRDLYSSEKEKMQEELKALDFEIRERQKTRARLLEPIDAMKEEAEELMLSAEAKMSEAKAALEEADELIHNVTQKLDVVSEKEAKVDAEVQELALKRGAIEMESELVSKGHARLNKEISDFRAASSESLRHLAEREARLRAETQASAATLSERESRLLILEKEVEAAKVRLEDERGVLQRAWDELKKKQL